MAGKKTREEIEKELDEEVEEELDDEWEDEGQQSPGAILLRSFGEIRKRIFIILGTLVVFSSIAGWFCTDIFDFLMRPLCSAFQNRPGGAPSVPGMQNVVNTAAQHGMPAVNAGGCAVYPADLLEPTVVLFKMAILIGVLCTLPVIFWQLWAFLSRWIPDKARRWILGFVISATVMFLGGAAFGFFVVFPKAFDVLLNLAGNDVIPMPTMESYFSVISMLLLGFGATFELPLLMFVTSRVGLTNAAFFSRYRRHAIFALMIFAAAVTPTTDPFTMMAMGGPLVLLYEVGILASRFAGKSGPTILEQRMREMKLMLEDADDGDDDEYEDDDEDEDAPSEGAGA